MDESEIQIDSVGHRLSATSCLPSDTDTDTGNGTGTGRWPMVLMVHGSGPLDRDENMKGQALDVFSAIAHRLAGVGIGSLRYDKRGCGASSGDYYATGHFDLVEDSVSWIDALSRLDYCAQIFVLGHSEGCIIAAQASLRRPSVAGLVLLCPFVENMRSILLRQAGQLEKDIKRDLGFTAEVTVLAADSLPRTEGKTRRVIRQQEKLSG